MANSTDAFDFCTPDNTVNLSNPDRATRWTYTETQQFIIATVNPLVGTFGVAGNMAFLWMVFRVQALRTSVDAYLATLAVSDTMFIVFISAYTRVGWVSQNINRAAGLNSAFSCAFCVFAWILFYYASLGLMTLISFERYLAICHPMNHLTLKGKKRNIKLLSAVWLAAMIVSIPYALEQSVFTTYCVIWPKSWQNRDLPKTFNVCINRKFVFITDYYRPIFTLSMFTMVLLLNLFLFFKIIRTLGKRSVAETDTSDRKNKSTQVGRTRIQVTKTLVANGIIFFVCQFSYRFYYIDEVLDLFDIKFMTTHEKLNVYLSGHVLQMVNSSINPYLYVFTCRHYRKALMKAVSVDNVLNKITGASRENSTSVTAQTNSSRLRY